MTKNKDEVISFKVDSALARAIKRIPNRSEFIRTAILSALEHNCPLCQGTGILTPDQNKHWEEFSEHHALKQCSDCEAVHLVCEYH
ncbi:hypothetical protein ES703_125754 [subsurface metagenome]